MGRAKGLSFDEKRSRMLDYFIEKKEVLTLKELEKILPKVKQIVSQSVKEVLQSLVDDDVVDYDKIGSGNFFWALPSTAMVKRENALAKALKKVEMVEAELAKDTERYNELLSDRRRCSGREQKLIELSKIDSKDSFLDGQCSSFSSRGPETVQKLDNALKQSFEGATRWTENVFCMQSFFKDKMSEYSDEKFFKMFELGSDFDYLD